MMSLTIMSCDSDDDGPNCPEPLTGELNNIETEFSGKWSLTSIEAEDEVDLTDDSVDNPSTNIFEQYSECQRDNVYEFKNDRVYSFNQGSNETDCTNKQALSGTWMLNNNVLTFVALCTSQSINIDLNDDNSEFVIESNYTFVNVDNETINTKVIFTYQKMDDPQ